MPNESFGRYTVTRRLGSGGMAAVYEGQDPMLNRRVAIKVIHAHLATEAGFDQRFLQEAQLVASLRHPHIIQLYDFGVAEDQPFMVMEYLDGGTLSDRLSTLRARGEKMSLPDVVSLTGNIASALSFAHERGAIHRDIKPANILFTADGQPILSDFGIAKILTGASQLSVTGSVLGSPAYMAPEQAEGKPVDARSDLYALGIVLYEMLCSRVPFMGDSPTAVMIQHLTKTPPPPRQLNPDLSPALEAVVLKAMAKDPDARFATATELADAVRAAVYEPTAAATLAMTSASTVAQPTVTAAAPRAAGTAGQPGAGTPAADPVQTGQAQATKPAPSRRWVVPVAALVGILLVAFGAFAVFGGGLMPTAATTPGASGLGRFRDGTAASDEILVTANGLPDPASGTGYEAWLISHSAEARQSLGFLTWSNGQGSLTYTDPSGANLLADFDAIAVTVEPLANDSPVPGNKIVLQGELPTQALMHIRHLLVSHEGTPGEIGYADGLYVQALLLKDIGDEAMQALEAQDLDGVRQSGEWFVNIIEGQGGEHFGNLNGDGIVTNPGDGFGMLPAAGRPGYVQGTYDHVSLLADTPDANTGMTMHAGHVENAVRNVGDWVIELRDTALQLAKAQDIASIQAATRTAASLSTRILNGQDLNGDERIDPIPGEAGAEEAYQHAQYMADITLTPP